MPIYDLLLNVIYGQPVGYAGQIIIYTLVAILFMAILDGVFDVIVTLIKKV